MATNREVTGFNWQMRRKVERVASYFEAATTKPYPKTSAALGVLRQALDDERTRRNRANPIYPDARPSKKRRCEEQVSRKHYYKCRRLQRANDELRAKLVSNTGHKPGGKYISPEWIVRIFLTSPGQNARGMNKAIRDVIGLDTNPISRDTMDKVRGTWVEFYNQNGVGGGGGTRVLGGHIRHQHPCCIRRDIPPPRAR